jgi:N-acetylglucosaminyldiphosphoundecaprenol N-acetyl-beta-D-mannosaminyltransferase
MGPDDHSSRRPGEILGVELPGVGLVRWFVGGVEELRSALLRGVDGLSVGYPVLVTINTDTVRIAARDDELRGILCHAVAVPDGWPVALYVSVRAKIPIRRATGSDLTARFLGGHFGPFRAMVVGGSEECHDLIRRRLSKNSGVEVLSYHCPTRTEIESPEWVAQLAAHGARVQPDIVFLAFNQPTGEIAADRYVRGGGLGTCLCVGASLDMFAGLQRRAPRSFQQLGLEWAWRLVTNPRRLGRRYLADLPVAMTLLVKSLIRLGEVRRST